MDVSPAPTPAAPPRRSRAGSPFLFAILVLVIAVVAGGLAWRTWQQRQAQSEVLAGQQRQALDARLDLLAHAQRAQLRRMQQAEATNRVLRDEVLGVGERAALLEDSVSRLADPDRTGAQALRLDELELLLGIGQQRLLLADDIDGARRALALAAPLLAGVNDPAYLSLQQTLAQEQAALEALGADPRMRAEAQLEALDRALRESTTTPLRQARAQAPWYRRVLDRIVRVQPTARAGLGERADRDVAMAAVQIELTLARAAVERRDQAGLARALDRIDGWLQRLQPGQLAQQRQLIATLKAAPLRADSALAGSTLQQLRALRGQ